MLPSLSQYVGVWRNIIYGLSLHRDLLSTLTRKLKFVKFFCIMVSFTLFQLQKKLRWLPIVFNKCASLWTMSYLYDPRYLPFCVTFKSF